MTKTSAVDLAGQKFGRLAVMERAGSTTKGLALWRCTCDCGAERIVAGAALRSGNSRSCGCKARESASSRATQRNLIANPLRALDLTGQVFDRLTAVRRLSSGLWLCTCECGAERKVSTTLLRHGSVKSCGCLQREMTVARNRSRIVDRPSYYGAHDRVKRTRGSASRHECVDCKSPAREWSYNRTDPNQLQDERGMYYSGDPNYYEPRCASCHRLFDHQISPSVDGENHDATTK